MKILGASPWTWLWELTAYTLLCSELLSVNLFLYISNSAYRRLLRLVFNIFRVNELQNVYIFLFWHLSIFHSLGILLHVKKFSKLLWHVQLISLCEFLMWTTRTYSHLLHLLHNRDGIQNSLPLLDEFDGISWLFSPWYHQRTNFFLVISGGLARVDNLLYISINALIKYLFHGAPLNEQVKNKIFIST